MHAHAQVSSIPRWAHVASHYSAKQYVCTFGTMFLPQNSGRDVGAMVEKLPTGIGVLDRMLEGGIPEGSVIALTASPTSQSELILFELTAARRTLYITTRRSQEAIHDAFERTNTHVGQPNIQSVPGDAPLDHVKDLIRTLPDGSNLIIDPIDPLEQLGTARYTAFLNSLQTQMINTGSLAFLHCIEGRAIPAERDITEYVADVIFGLDTTVSGDSVDNRLAVPKFRGGRAMDEPIKLELRDTVSIDTSRDIA